PTGVFVSERGSPARVLQYAPRTDCQSQPCYDEDGDFVHNAEAISFPSTADLIVNGPSGSTSNFGAAFARSGDMILVGDVAASPASASGSVYLMQGNYQFINQTPPLPPLAKFL